MTIDRRAFLVQGMTGLIAAVKTGRAGERPSDWASQVEHSDKYELRDQASGLDGVVVTFPEGSRQILLELMSWDRYPEGARRFTLPSAARGPGLHIGGATPYEMSIVPARDVVGISALVAFVERTTIRVYAPTEPFRNVVIVSGPRR